MMFILHLLLATYCSHVNPESFTDHKLANFEIEEQSLNVEMYNHMTDLLKRMASIDELICNFRIDLNHALELINTNLKTGGLIQIKTALFPKVTIDIYLIPDHTIFYYNRIFLYHYIKNIIGDEKFNRFIFENHNEFQQTLANFKIIKTNYPLFEEYIRKIEYKIVGLFLSFNDLIKSLNCLFDCLCYISEYRFLYEGKITNFEITYLWFFQNTKSFFDTLNEVRNFYFNF